jgi:hypothetical protein
MNQEMQADIGEEAEALWMAGATYASETIVDPSKYPDERRWQFVQGVHWRLQELWSEWGSP